jgi:hypothetical protein
MAADGTVTIDPRTHTLTVRPAPDARAYAKVLWNEGVRAQAEAPGYGGPPTVWASGGGADKIAYGMPTARGDALEFRFHPGHQQYEKAGLAAGSPRTLRRRPRKQSDSQRPVHRAMTKTSNARGISLPPAVRAQQPPSWR